MKRFVLICLFLFLLTGCTLNPPITQISEDISQIELIYVSDEENEIRYEIPESEIAHFVDDLMELKCKKNLQPVSDLGQCIVQIHYGNQSAYIIGNRADAYITDGEYTLSGWYHYSYENLTALFDEYIPD